MVQRQEPEAEISGNYNSGGDVEGAMAPGTADTMYSTGSVLSTSESVKTKYGEYETSMNEETQRKSFALPGHDNSGKASARPLSGPLGVNYCQNVGQPEERRNDRHETMTSPPWSTSDVNVWNPGEPDSTYIENYSRAGYSDGNHDEVSTKQISFCRGKLWKFEIYVEMGRTMMTTTTTVVMEMQEKFQYRRRKQQKNQTNEIKMLLLTDFVLKEMESNGNTYVHVQKDLDFDNVMDTVNILPTFPNLNSVVFALRLQILERI